MNEPIEQEEIKEIEEEETPGESLGAYLDRMDLLTPG